MNEYWVGDISIDADRLPEMHEGQLVTLSLLAQVERIHTEKVDVTDFGDQERRTLDGVTRVTLSIRTLYSGGVTYGAEWLASI